MPDSGMMVIRDRDRTRRDKAARIAAYYYGGAAIGNITAGVDKALDNELARIDRQQRRAKSSEGVAK